MPYVASIEIGDRIAVFSGGAGIPRIDMTSE
jgi:hypothetical protein